MDSLRWLLLSSLVFPASADQQPPMVASTSPVDEVPSWQQSSFMSLQVKAPDGKVVTASVIPLTVDLGLKTSAVTIQGDLVSATSNTYLDIRGSHTLAYLSCDDSNSSLIDQNLILNTVMQNQPAAILLYSQRSQCCSFHAPESTFQTVLSMTDATEAVQALNMTSSAQEAIKASISGTLKRESNDSRSNVPGQGVAMSVLYTITGLVSLLFLLIIITGAVRAHRHPERYGPRAAQAGRSRQSRAKGIARAVLDTIPIVKFGSQENRKPDPEIELETGSGVQEAGSTGGSREEASSTPPKDSESNAAKQASPETGGASSSVTSAAEAAGPNPGDTDLSCSICTEDFKLGEDVRVLPCSHKYHPACIDPWLTNVSGTCPLCRLDLRSGGEGIPGGENAESEEQLSPPLRIEDDRDPGAAPESGSQPLPDSEVSALQTASPEQRREILRRYRSHRQHGDSSATRGRNEEARRSARLTTRLRERFRIRTRAQRETRRSSQDSESAGPA